MKQSIFILFSFLEFACYSQNSNGLGIYGSLSSSFRTSTSTAEFKTSEKASISNDFGIISSYACSEHLEINTSFGLANWYYGNSTYFSSENLAQFHMQTGTIQLGVKYFLNRDKLAPYAGIKIGYEHVLYAKYVNQNFAKNLLFNTTTSFGTANISVGVVYALSDKVSLDIQGFYTRAITSLTIVTPNTAYSEFPFKYGVQGGIHVYLD